MATREQVIELWQTCFHDDESFVRLFFDHVYTPSHLRSCEREGELLAMLQALPYLFTAWGKEFECSYIAGVATAPQERNKGLMRHLLGSTLQELGSKNIPLCLLIPAEPWLYDYYARSGFATVCYTTETWIEPHDTMPRGYRECKIPADKQHKLYDRLCRRRDASVLHMRPDYYIILADFRLSGGHVHTIAAPDGTPCALAWVVTEADRIIVKEYVTTSSDATKALICCLGKRYGNRNILYNRPTPTGTPRAMIRITNVPGLLQQWATAHPDVDVTLTVNDPLIPRNNGTWHVADGRLSHPARNAESIASISVNRLTEFIFGQADIGACHIPPVTPYVTLMLD